MKTFKEMKDVFNERAEGKGFETFGQAFLFGFVFSPVLIVRDLKKEIRRKK